MYIYYTHIHIHGRLATPKEIIKDFKTKKQHERSESRVTQKNVGLASPMGGIAGIFSKSRAWRCQRKGERCRGGMVCEKEWGPFLGGFGLIFVGPATTNFEVFGVA